MATEPKVTDHQSYELKSPGSISAKTKKMSCCPLSRQNYKLKPENGYIEWAGLYL